MHSPRGHRVSHTMTNKTKSKSQGKTKMPQQQQKQKKKTPFADAGAIVGSRLGSMFNAPYLGGVGKWLGSGIGSIFGSGDYQMMGPAPSYNVLTNAAQIPKFSTTERTNVICHREYIGEIAGTTLFSNRQFNLNPGDQTVFPWLSTIAQNYQQYRFHGLIFEFKSLVTDFVTSGAPGAIIMATNYNATEPVYASKVQMENSEFAVSAKPTVNLIHGVECDPAETPVSKLYVASNSSGTNDLRLYNLGTTQVATTGNPVQLIGELWVSYCIEFFKPILNEDIGGNVNSLHVTRSGVTNASPMGTIGVRTSGDINFGITSTLLVLQGVALQKFMITFTWTGTTPVAWANPNFTYTNLEVTGFVFDGSGTFFMNVPAVTLSTGVCQTSVVVRVPGTYQIGNAISIGLSGTGILPSGTTTCDIVVTELDGGVV